MNRDYKYLFLYLAIIFGGWWGTVLFFLIFSNYFANLIGELTPLHPLIVFFTYLPSITGLTIYYLIGNISSVKTVLFKFLPRKKDLFWFPIIFVIFIFFALSMRFGSLFFGIAVPKITYNIPQIISGVILNFFRETGIIGGVIGWVGFLLPCLQGRLENNISSGLLTGLIFGLWLFPGFALSPSAGNISYILYVIQLMTFFIFQSYIFNATKGCLIFYLFAFGLISAGSHIQLYYFNAPIQVMQIVFFMVVSIIIHIILKKYTTGIQLQTLNTLIFEKTETVENQEILLRNNLI